MTEAYNPESEGARPPESISCRTLGKLALIRLTQLSPKKIQLSEVEQLLIKLKENGF